MACGMPILASAKGEVKKIVNDANCGICVENGNINQIAEAIFILEQSNLDNLRKSSRLYFLENYSKEKLMNHIDRYLKHYL